MNLCTLFDKNYISKGLALLSSICDYTEYGQRVNVYVLAMDKETENAVNTFMSDNMRKRISVWTIPHSMLLKNYSFLKEARENRSYIEYLWTLPSSLCLFSLALWCLDDIAYLDADTCFFNDLSYLQEEIESDICIVPHRWAPKYAERLRVNGTYNVSWVYFRGSRGIECLSAWRNQTLTWCKNKVEDGKFADQGYLEDWPETWGAQVITHPGVNLAPWNQEQYEYHKGSYDDRLFVEGRPIIFYHFHEFRERKDGSFYWTGYPVHPFLVEHLYPEYERRYRNAQCAIDR